MFIFWFETELRWAQLKPRSIVNLLFLLSIRFNARLYFTQAHKSMNKSEIPQFGEKFLMRI